MHYLVSRRQTVSTPQLIYEQLYVYVYIHKQPATTKGFSESSLTEMTKISLKNFKNAKVFFAHLKVLDTEMNRTFDKNDVQSQEMNTLTISIALKKKINK